MKKILLILSLALIIPFTGISQKYDGVQSLYVNSEEFPELGGDRAGWFGWEFGFQGSGWILHWSIPEWGVFNRFEPEDLTAHVGENITRVRYYWPVNSQNNPNPTLWANPRIRIYTGGSYDGAEFERGNMVVDFEAPMPPNTSGWKTVNLPEPVTITGEEELWFGVVFFWEDGHMAFTVDYEDPEVYELYYAPHKSDLVYFGDEYDEFGSLTEDGDIGYSWLVEAYTVAGCENSATNLNVVYNATTCDAELTWNAPAADPNAKYNIYRNGEKIVSNHTTTSYTDLATASGNNPAIKQTWEVKGLCGSTEAPGISKEIDPCTDCDAPTNVKADYTSCTVAEITWDAVDGAIEYNVFRDNVNLKTVTGTKYTDIKEDGFNATTVWEVTTVCAIGESKRSDEAKLAACTGIRDNEITFSIHPNPATTKITIQAGNIFNTVDIVNFLGQTIISQNNSTDNVEIDVSNLNSGVYFVRIASENGVSVQKFVKK